MSTWKGIVGKSFTANAFDDYVRELVMDDWKPTFVVLHNTSEPRLTQWHSTPGDQRMRNLEEYYRNPDPRTGKPPWSAGPHLFIADDLIWVFTPLTTSGVHSPSWNAVSWGVEMVGEYDEELFDEQVRNNTVAALATLHAKLGLDPRGLRFHKEDPKTTHKDCPGKHVVQSDVIQRVIDRIPIPDAGEHLPACRDDENVAIGVVVLQSSQLKGNPVLDAIAARQKILQRVLGSNAVTEGTGPLQDALNALAAFDASLFHINMGDNNANRGIYGALTEEAVRCFQELKGLPITGQVDAATLATIDLALVTPQKQRTGEVAAHPEVVGPATSTDRPVSILLEKGDPVAHLKELARKILTDVPVYKLADRDGYFFRANMAIDVDGSPRAYCPGNRNPTALDTLDDADSEGSSTTYVQGEQRHGRLGVGPSAGFYVSGTALRLDQPWRCDSFVDAEQIPYLVFPPNFKEVRVGDLAVVVNLLNNKWTHAIFADTNAHVGEASIKTARNLGREDLSARNGDDDNNYVYLIFPGTRFEPLQTAPHWPDEIIQANATTLFEKWGGIEQIKKLFPHV
jgi:hypothetical protein